MRVEQYADTPCSRIRGKPCNAVCVWLTVLHCCLGNLKSRWKPPQQYLWVMEYPLLKYSTLSPDKSAGCPPPATTTSRFKISTCLWLVRPGLSLMMYRLPAHLHPSLSWLLACGKWLVSSYPLSQPHLRSRISGTGSPHTVWFHDVMLISPYKVLSTQCHSGDTSHRGGCTPSFSVGLRRSAQTCKIPINQPQKAVTV